MDKKLILRNERTGEYFTNDYERYWSKNIKDAYRYNKDEDMESLIERFLGESYNNALEGVEYLELVTFFCR